MFGRATITLGIGHILVVFLVPCMLAADEAGLPSGARKGSSSYRIILRFIYIRRFCLCHRRDGRGSKVLNYWPVTHDPTRRVFNPVTQPVPTSLLNCSPPLTPPIIGRSTFDSACCPSHWSRQDLVHARQHKTTWNFLLHTK